MRQSISFILNDEEITTNVSPTVTLLDYLRYEKNLKGTKIGCREGDCGACTVLLGELINNDVKYHTITSCLTPLGNVIGKHVISIEGINAPMNKLSLVQQAMVDKGGTQCGACTPGFVVSLTEFALNSDLSFESGLESINGNICRCTGYKSIERAIGVISEELLRDGSFRNNRDQIMLEKNVIPSYYINTRDRLIELNKKIKTKPQKIISSYPLIGGGTDLYVQKHDNLQHQDLFYLNTLEEKNNLIKIDKDFCILGSGTTFTDIYKSKIINGLFPNLKQYIKLIASTPIRNLATIGGNIVNASPIGDFTIFFLALNAELILRKEEVDRTILLKDFYLGYKTLDLTENEFVKDIKFRIPSENSKFNFEKVSKRTYLDIASVNSAINMKVENGTIISVGISAGGLAPIPKYFDKTVDFLTGKELTSSVLIEAQDIAQTEVTPISDARGTKEYKRLLFRQLFFTHFITLYGDRFELEDLI